MKTRTAPEVLVIGAGVMGCGVALRLAQAGASVCVLERSIPGAEASSAAAGMLAPQMEAHGPGPFLDLCLESRALYPAFAEELRSLTGIGIQYVPSGALVAAFDQTQAAKLQEKVAWQRSAGLRAEWLTPGDARSLEPELAAGILGAAHFPDDHQVDNRLLVRALSLAAATCGARFRTGYVRGLRIERERVVGAEVDGESLSADAVVLAAGSWSSLVQGAGVTAEMVRPAKGQMMALELRLPGFRHLLSSEKGYLVPRQDGRVIAGSTLEFKGFDKEVTGEGLAKILGMALELCPMLAQAKVVETWAGLRPFTEGAMPLMGPGPLPGLFLATGHYRNGILLAPITAEKVAAAVLA